MKARRLTCRTESFEVAHPIQARPLRLKLPLYCNRNTCSTARKAFSPAHMVGHGACRPGSGVGREEEEEEERRVERGMPEEPCTIECKHDLGMCMQPNQPHFLDYRSEPMFGSLFIVWSPWLNLRFRATLAVQGCAERRPSVHGLLPSSQALDVTT